MKNEIKDSEQLTKDEQNERLNSGKEGLTAKEKAIIVNELRLKYKLKNILEVIGMPKSTYEYYKGTKHLNAEKKKTSKR